MMEPCTSSDDVVGTSSDVNNSAMGKLRAVEASLEGMKSALDLLKERMTDIEQQLIRNLEVVALREEAMKEATERFQELSLENSKLMEVLKEHKQLLMEVAAAESSQGDAKPGTSGRDTESATPSGNGKGQLKVSNISECLKGPSAVTATASTSSASMLNAWDTPAVQPSTSKKEHKGKRTSSTKTTLDCKSRSYFEKNPMEPSSSKSILSVEGDLLSSFVLMDPRHKSPAKSTCLSGDDVKNTYVCSELEAILNPKVKGKELTYEEALRKIDEEVARENSGGIYKGTPRKGSRGQATSSISTSTKLKDDATVAGGSGAQKRAESKGSVTPRVHPKMRKTSGQVDLDMKADKFNNMFDDVFARIRELSNSLDDAGKDLPSADQDSEPENTSK